MAEHAPRFMPTFSPESIDTVLNANIAVAKSCGTLAKHVLGQTRDSFEEAIEAGRKLSTAKSLDGLIDIQAELAQESVKHLFERSKSLQALTAAVFKEMSAPFNGAAEVSRSAK